MIEVNVNVIAFELGPITVSWYGILVAVAVVTLVTWGLISIRKDSRITADTMISAAIVGIPSGIIFSRFLHVVDHWSYYMSNPGKIIGGDGLSIWGAVLGATIGIWIFSRFSKKFSFGHLADVIAPGIILAQAIGRVGCTLNGCCYGKMTDVPWAFIYTHPSTHGLLNVPVHPTQVYEIIYDVIVFGVLLLLRKRLKPDGALFLVYLSLYSVWRIGIDFVRDGTNFLFGLHEAQVVSIVVLLVTIPLLWLRFRNRDKEGEKEDTIQTG